MSERPLLLFPEPQVADKTKGHSVPPGKIFKPNAQRQFQRLTPVFGELTRAFALKNIVVQQSTIGINPEYALVFEVIGSVDDFYKAVNKVEGLEWIFDQTTDNIEPDEYFYQQNDEGEVVDTSFNGRVYCVMTNLSAMNELLSMWRRYSNGETNVFPRGTAPIRKVFELLKSIRLWNAQDRIYETKAIEYWKEELEFTGKDIVTFEIELFCRNNEDKRTKSISEVTYAISALGGHVLKICYIEEISYHSLLVNLPRAEIQQLVDNYESVSLVNVDGIMFFRPMCQSVFCSDDSSIPYENETEDTQDLQDPIIAVLDGMPMQNHRLLKNRIIVDDPDEYEKYYQVKDRKHGTAMASLIIHGDINSGSPSLQRKIYFRPIMKPYTDWHDNSIEKIPEDVMIVDLIHRSIKRMIEGENDESPASPMVKVINLSIGDPYRQFATIMSPLARLLDWLSFKYKILFVVSAGNQSKFEEEFSEPFSNFKSLSINERTAKVYDCLSDYKSYLRVLSPAETINNLTIGATYSDFCKLTENERQAFVVENGYPSPISAIGFGYNKMINPDLFYYGGRKFLVEDLARRKSRWLNNTNEPGCKSASPLADGVSDGCAFSFGTSDATAQITHEAGICYDVLYDIFVNENERALPQNHIATLLKSMLVHGASWGSISTELATHVSETNKKLTRWLGNGIPDVAKVQDCTKNRVTLIGLGELVPDEAHLYRLPLPFNFSTEKIKRKLTITLSYLTSTVPTKQKYRGSQIWFEVNQIDNLKMTRQNSDWQAVRKGTLQHEIFCGENAVVWDENNELIIKVNCKDDAIKTNDKIPYGMFVTFEVAEGIDLDVYTKIASKIRTTVSIQNN